MKRPGEDSRSGDSDTEENIDVGCENMYSGHRRTSFVRCASPTTTTQVIARKKRRGVIEKRRRDRINNSLLELRRLVPSAFEKQGSAKLEKAEILQMTVDHLKMLQATGGRGFFDAQVLALDFLSLGFRECVSEVSRYMSSVEGLDCTDPLRSRLLSHLTTCASHLHLSPQHHYPPPHPYLHPHWPPNAALRPALFGLNTLPVPAEGACVRLVPPHCLASVQAHFSPAAASPASSSGPQTPHSSSKPYRPWGTEVGAF
ncbi:hairy/enhancer-of-split related with YRPW motif protein 2 [Eucyclogobius newberryi]|uniref:hairy/enhancer-of-split related with YRPW motif protein 2 n=1 Tax=Eucyclogobius newberryi TaxID=166745 RepID=UPI003B59D1AC